jgi:hypothetical protein
VPTALLRAGVIQVLDSTGKNYIAYNLNPTPVTVNGVTYQPATCGTGNVACDPRGIGLNPIVSQIWSKYIIHKATSPRSGCRRTPTIT